MADCTILDYIRWRGDLSFKVSPFCLADSVVLCQLSYVDFSQVLFPNSSKGITLEKACEGIAEKDCFRLLTAMGGDDAFFRAAAASKRFGQLKLTHYTDIFDKNYTQFAAIHFELDRNTSYVAFRGTDSSIIGWKEDFMMSFQSVPAQDGAALYLAGTMQGRKKYYVGGHSKGGNLAVYAVSKLKPAEQRKILRIYANDSPGFSPDVYPLESILALKPLITRLVPVYGIIGRLFQMEAETTKIVSSIASGILQHDLMTWKLDGPEFCFAEQFDVGSEVLIRTFHNWIENIDEDGRKQFVDWLFDSLSVKGAVSVSDLKMKDLPDVLKSIFSASKEAKDMAMDLPKMYFTEAGKEIYDEWNEYFKSMKKQAAKKKTDTDSKP